MAVRVIDVRERVMERNDEIARTVRERRTTAGVPALNLVSSPGAGKTALLERTLDVLNEEMRIAVVTGDLQTQNDADRLAAHTSHLVQAVVTNGACHLDARQIDRALEEVDLDETDLLLIENVGNLVCPASWDLGEDAKVVLLSVTEGDDKPEKYPKIFRGSDYAVITKTDLLPYVPFSLSRAAGFMRDANPFIRIFYTSVTTGEGMDEWCEFLRETARRASPAARMARR
jgi:hydrogenase nickel incorporation protein HypB